MRTLPFVGVVLLATLGGVGCGGGQPPSAGGERGACFPNGTCNAGLTCLSNFCVRVELGDGSVDAAGPDAATPDVGGGGTDADAAAAPEAGADLGVIGGTPAAHARLPQIANQGGPVLDHPRVQPIYYSSTTDKPDVEAFLAEFAKATAWAATTAEYGVGPLVLAPPITLPGGAPQTMTDDALAMKLLGNLSGPAPVLGGADPSTIYMFVLPQGSTVTFSDGSTCCSDYGGYHSEATSATGVTVPYAVICTCPAAFGLNLSPLDSRTTTVSHELVEAATDPFPYSNPAYVGSDRANIIWNAVTGGELADMCAIYPDANVVPPGSTYMIQRSWSNAAAAQSRNPCVPRDPAAPSFGAYPVLGPVNAGTAQNPFTTQGAIVALGTTRVIDVVLSSDGPPSLSWSVGAYTYEDLRGGNTTNLGVSLDKTTGVNGDVLRLTVSPKRANPDFGAEAFVLISRRGSGDKLESNVSMGLIVNP